VPVEVAISTASMVGSFRIASVGRHSYGVEDEHRAAVALAGEAREEERANLPATVPGDEDLKILRGRLRHQAAGQIPNQRAFVRAIRRGEPFPARDALAKPLQNAPILWLRRNCVIVLLPHRQEGFTERQT
jgi:hypothetical protein